jgi:hypothetical protein
VTDPTDPTKPAAPSLHVDSDWKAQAQAERERLAQQEAERAAREPAGGPEELPPADFRSLVGMLTSQAIMGLGTMADPQGRVVIDLAGSQFAIDLLQMLAEKTKGNLTPDESKELGEVLRSLSTRFAQITQMVAEQMHRNPDRVHATPTAPAGTAPIGAVEPSKPSGASKLILPS